MKTRLWLRLFVVPALLAAACSGAKSNSVGPSPGPDPFPPNPTPVIPLIAVFAGAGDIADCTSLGADGGAHGEATARLLDKMTDATVFTAGDNAYFDGTAEEFRNCYGPRWGRHKSRTYPSPGNHEYQRSPSPYFDYFGDRAGPRGAGFYSYTLGNWHIVSLNSNVPVGPGSEQVMWLDDDLQANSRTVTAKCTLAYWHHPLFTSGPSAGSGGLMRDVWRVLYDRGVDVVVNGHDHLYERFDPQDPNGRRDLPAGIRQFTVGSGGAPLYDFGASAANSVSKVKAYGVLRLTLRDVGYDSVFIEAGSELPLDVTSGNLCH
jgi:acid phosphatase type 7